MLLYTRYEGNFMKICPKCGQENADFATKCIDCGTILDPVAAEAISVQEKQEYIKKNAHSGPANTSLALSIVSLSLTAVSLYIFGVLSFVSFALAIVATVMGKKNIYDSRGKAGMIIGIIGIIAGLVVVILEIITLFN